MATSAAPIELMEARSVGAIPKGREWQYEPKWDGFRCLLARDGNLISMQSKSGQNLARYFPEVVAAARELRESSFVLDGELVVQVGRELSFGREDRRVAPRSALRARRGLWGQGGDRQSAFILALARFPRSRTL